MFVRVLCAFAPMTVGSLMYTGAIPVSSMFMGGSYSATVPAHRDTVKAHLASLHVNEITGFAVSEHMPELRRQNTEDGYRWTLNIEGKPYVEMVATLSPEGDGSSTQVIGRVAKTDQYDENKAPLGMRDLSPVEAIFGAALDMELNPLLPPEERLSQPKLKERRMAISTAAVTSEVMKNPMAISVEARRRQQEFETGMADMEKVSAEMEAKREQHKGVTFRPGKPMVDVGR